MKFTEPETQIILESISNVDLSLIDTLEIMCHVNDLALCVCKNQSKEDLFYLLMRNDYVLLAVPLSKRDEAYKQFELSNKSRLIDER